MNQLKPGSRVRLTSPETVRHFIAGNMRTTGTIRRIAKATADEPIEHIRAGQYGYWVSLDDNPADEVGSPRRRSEFVRLPDSTRTYTNLDGLSYTTTTAQENHISSYLRGQLRLLSELPLRGIVGSSELAIHTKITERVGIWLFYPADLVVDPCDQIFHGYGWVMLDGGALVPGIVHRWPDGTFRLA